MFAIFGFKKSSFFNGIEKILTSNKKLLKMPISKKIIPSAVAKKCSPKNWATWICENTAILHPKSLPILSICHQKTAKEIRIRQIMMAQRGKTQKLLMPLGNLFKEPPALCFGMVKWQFLIFNLMLNMYLWENHADFGPLESPQRAWLTKCLYLCYSFSCINLEPEGTCCYQLLQGIFSQCFPQKIHLLERRTYSI